MSDSNSQHALSHSFTPIGVHGMPLLLLRLEGVVGFLGLLLFYYYFQGPWWLFALAFFVPDLGLLGYLISPRIGALAYNILHTHILAALLASLGLLFSLPTLFYLAIISSSHVHFDRMLGLGLKYDTGFAHTHLGCVLKSK